ncbi:unnamed protein product [Thelazia callipaeda]|uniref:ATP synthase mitochondrial F1 complex assembly factor 2 n=1 Tax=Thelazia callipaeda TaxID=103827 RepID=A0A0N5CXM4_THECL|nr:unnamed protein product [Thelazia callipaeda]
MNVRSCFAMNRWCSSMSRVKKRFYEEARAVYKPVEKIYNIYLDEHCLVTPKKYPVQISSEALAVAVAEEWNMQKNDLRENLMRLTGLIFTAIDNPTSLGKSDLISQILEFLEKDTVLYRLENNKNILELQKNRWDPVVEWVNMEYGLTAKPSYSIVEEAVVDDISRARLANQLSAYSFFQLIGLQYAVESLKSVFLTLATVTHRLHVDEAVELALLEHEYQSSIWGKVEWAHDIEREELISRLSAGVMAINLSYSEVEKEKHEENDELSALKFV